MTNIGLYPVLVMLLFITVDYASAYATTEDATQRICRESTNALIYAQLVPLSAVCVKPPGHNKLDDSCSQRRFTFESNFPKQQKFHVLIGQQANDEGKECGLAIDLNARYTISGKYVGHGDQAVFRTMENFGIDSVEAILLDYVTPRRGGQQSIRRRRRSVAGSERSIQDDAWSADRQKRRQQRNKIVGKVKRSPASRGQDEDEETVVFVHRCKKICRDNPACLFLSFELDDNSEAYACGLYRFRTLISSVLTPVEGYNTLVRFNENQCALPRSVGNPLAKLKSVVWFFNPLSNVCESFEWAGSAKDEIGLNHFGSEEECNECCMGFDAKVNIVKSAKASVLNGALRLMDSVTHTIDPLAVGDYPEFNLGLLCHEDCVRKECDVWSLDNSDNETMLTCSWYKVIDALNIQYDRISAEESSSTSINFVAILFRNTENICDQSSPMSENDQITEANWWYRRGIDNSCQKAERSAEQSEPSVSGNQIVNANHFETINNCFRFCGNFNTRLRIESRSVDLMANEEFQTISLTILPNNLPSRNAALEVCNVACDNNADCDAWLVIFIPAVKQVQCALVKIRNIATFQLTVQTNPDVYVDYGSRYRPEYCTVPINRGTMGVPQTRFAYNILSGRCEEFKWLLGEGTTFNFNIFETVAECEQFCGGFFDDLQVHQNVKPTKKTVPFATKHLDQSHPITLLLAECNQFCNQENEYVNPIKNDQAEPVNHCDFWHLGVVISDDVSAEFYDAVEGSDNATTTEKVICSLHALAQEHLSTDSIVETATTTPRLHFVGVKFRSEFCSLSLNRGIQQRYDQRWYYSAIRGRCSSFYAGRSPGNPLNFNHFYSEQSCQHFCQSAHVPVIEVDPCQDLFQPNLDHVEFQKLKNLFAECKKENNNYE